MKLIFTLAVLSAFCFADCPIQFGQIKDYDNYERNEMIVNFKNVAPKTIVGTKFAVSFRDTTGDMGRSVFDYTSNTILKPNYKVKNSWHLAGYSGQHEHGLQIWVTKVQFQDGTFWEQEEPKQCVADTRTNFRKPERW
jgi:hypothetical protein